VIRRYNNASVDFRSFYSWKNVKIHALSLKYVNHNWAFKYVNYSVTPLSLTFRHRHPKVKSQTLNSHVITSQTFSRTENMLHMLLIHQFRVRFCTLMLILKQFDSQSRFHVSNFRTCADLESRA